ncbi:unnamed protein product [Cuscuta campestris]|uniref:Retrotransposon gag domain-containing protein n=1 Tax=Cuscuta campestris TaxID=132261 RepID=A0A484MNJ4_9ASTE|nr:unnamed protein product [Cuscuta campestris]
MSNESRTMSHEELIASNTALKAQVEYLAKEVAKLTKMKLNELQGSDREEDVSSSGTMKAKANEGSDFKVDIPTFEGKNDPDEFLEWLESVEHVFDFKDVSDEKKVKIVALKFRKSCTRKMKTSRTFILSASFGPMEIFLSKTVISSVVTNCAPRNADPYDDDDDYQVNNGSDYYPYHEEPPYDTLSRNFRYSPSQDSDRDNYYDPHGDQDDYDQSGPTCDDQSDPLIEEIIRLEEKIFYLDEVLFAEGSWYKPPYCRDYTLFVEEQIEANKGVGVGQGVLDFMAVCLAKLSMSNPSQTLTNEELQASNAALKAQVEYLAKQVAQLTKMKLRMADTPEESDEEQEVETHPTGDSNTNTGGSSHEKGATDFKDVPKDKKVKLIALKLRKYASTWWTNLTTKRRREGKAPINTWLKMRALMKKKFLPEQYVRDNFARLQQLRQSTRSVEDYTREFEELLMRCDLQDDDSQTLVRYLFGLNTQIANVVELQSYDTFEELSKLALKELYQEDGDFKEVYARRLIRPYENYLLGEGYLFHVHNGSNYYQVHNGSNYYPYHEEPPYDTPSENFGYSPYQDSDGEDYYEPHGDHDDYDRNGPIYDDQADPLVEEIIRLEQKIFYFDEVLFAEGSWYEPPYSRDYTLFAEEQIEANKVAIRERAKLLESVRKEKEFERRLCEGSDMMQKMLDDFQRERLEAEAKADKLVNDLCKAIELKRSFQSQDPQLEEVNAQKEALEPKTNPETSNHQVPVLEDLPGFTPSQKPESITTLARATVVMLPKSLPSQVTTSIVVHEVEPTERPDSKPPTLIQEKEEEVLPTAINDHLLNCVQDTPPEEPVLEEVEPITCPQDSIESEQESTDDEVLCTDEPILSIETCTTNDSSEASDQTFFHSLLDGCDYVCPKDGWNLKSWDELLVSDNEDSSLGKGTVIIIEPQMDGQPIEGKEEINIAMKANDVDQLRRLPPPPIYLESPPFILLPPSHRDESRILDLDRARNQTRWNQKRVRTAKLYDSRIGKSRKKWGIPYSGSEEEVSGGESTRFLQPSRLLDPTAWLKLATERILTSSVKSLFLYYFEHDLDA